MPKAVDGSKKRSGNDMNKNAELLNFIYQNSQMGTDTINQLLGIIQDGEFETFLREQEKEYAKIHEQARTMLNDNGFDEKGISTFDKVKTYLMINMQTLTDKSVSHIAEMMILGSNMGIVDGTKNLQKYDDTEKDIVNLMEKLIKFEEKNVEKLKAFL